MTIFPGPTLNGVQFCDFARLPRRPCQRCKGAKGFNRWGSALVCGDDGQAADPPMYTRCVVGWRWCIPCKGRGFTWARCCAESSTGPCMTPAQARELARLAVQWEAEALPW